MNNINDNSQQPIGLPSFENALPLPAASPLQANVGAVGAATLGNVAAPAGAHNSAFEATDITEDCNNEIKKLKANNKELLPNKFHQGRLTLIGLASLVSIVAGAILGVVGFGLCVTGVGLPAGLGLMAGGVGLIGIGFPLIKYYHGKVVQEDAVKQNKENIKIVQKIMQEPPYRNFLNGMRNELGITDLSLPEFAIKYDLNKLFELRHIERAERRKKPPKKDPYSYFLLDYTAYFNFKDEKAKVINKILREINSEVRKLNLDIKRTTKVDVSKIPDRIESRKVLLKKAKGLKITRSNLLNDAPKVKEMSPEAFARFTKVKRATQEGFPFLDPPPKNIDKCIASFKRRGRRDLNPQLPT